MNGPIRKADLRIPDYLGHMIQACDRIAGYTAGMTLGAFLENTLVQDAVLRNIEILGEATNNVMESDPDFGEKHPEVPWVDIYGMRNRVAHGYFFINFEMVWGVVTKRVPELRRLIAAVVDGLPDEPRRA